MVGVETLALLATVSAVSAVVSSGVGWLLRGSFDAETPPDKRRRRAALVKTVALLGPLLGLLVLGVLGVTAVTDAFPSEFKGMAAAFWAGFTASLPGLMAASVVIRRERLDEPTGELVRRAVLWVGLSFGTLSVLLGVPILALLLDATVVVPLLPLPLLVVAATLLGLFHRHQVRSMCAKADPTPAERQLVLDVLADTGFDSDRLYFVADEDGEMDMWRPWAKGFGPFRYVYVSRQALDTYDEKTLEALLYLVAQPRSGYVRTLGWGLWFSLLGAGITAVTLDAGAGIVGLVTIAVFVWPFALYYFGRRRTLRVEASIAETVGGKTLHNAFVRQLEYLDTDDKGLLARFMLLVPSVETRMRRLEDRYGLDSYFDTPDRDQPYRRGHRDDGQRRREQSARNTQASERPRGRRQHGQQTTDTGGVSCPNCGASVHQNDRFCQQCGVSLADARGR